MRNTFNLRKRPLLLVSFIYLIIVGSYFLNSNSRNALAEAKSSHLSNDLKAKTILILLALIISVILVKMVNLQNFNKIFMQNKFFFKFIPLIFFLAFNALPTVIQSRKNFSVINLYYSILQVGNTFPNFIDLKQTVGFLIHNNVKNIGDEGLIYPRFILKLRIFNHFLQSSFAINTIAFETIVLFAWMIFDFSKKLSPIQIIGLTLLVVSPPFLLLIDRQNIDCLLILLIYVSASIYRKTDLKSIITIILIMLASLIKIYPIIILGYIFVTNKKIAIKLFSFMAMIITFSLIYPDLAPIQSFQVTDIAGSVGLPVLMAHLAGASSSGFFFSRTFILFLILMIFIQFNSSSLKRIDLIIDDRRAIFVIFGSLILIETLMVSTNYLYRMSYILFLIPMIGNFPKKSFHEISFLFFLLSIYLSPRSTGILMNLFLFPFLIFLISFIFNVIKSQAFNFEFHGNYMPNKTNN
jgi:hypothetical protein